MSANEEIARLREVLRRVAYDLALAEIALGYVEKEQARPTPTWQGLTDAELGVLLADSITEPVVVVVRRMEKMLREKNGGTR